MNHGILLNSFTKQCFNFAGFESTSLSTEWRPRRKQGYSATVAPATHHSAPLIHSARPPFLLRLPTQAVHACDLLKILDSIRVRSKPAGKDKAAARDARVANPWHMSLRGACSIDPWATSSEGSISRGLMKNACERRYFARTGVMRESINFRHVLNPSRRCHAYAPFLLAIVLA